MKNIKILFLIGYALLMLLIQSPAWAETTNTATETQTVGDTPASTTENDISPIVERNNHEEKAKHNPFVITLYKPTYILPYYYTGSPYNTIYQDNIPGNNELKHAEVKYQLSFKVPIWQNIFHHHSTLYAGYTQLSYWQLYNTNAFFRETDYEPEIFVANEVNIPLVKQWQINFLNAGLDHQSNGFGGTLERTWNRFYLSATASNTKWVLTIEPWYIFHDQSLNQHNPDIGKYLGYSQIVLGYHFYNQLIALATHNLIEGHARYATAQLSWSFPLTTHLNGYVQFFSGYGQSLIEYNHRTNSGGIGIAINDWA